MKSKNESVAHANCFVALELSRSKWLVGALLAGADQVATISVSGGDTSGLLSALNGLVAKADDLARISRRTAACLFRGWI
jgi:transposase